MHVLIIYLLMEIKLTKLPNKVTWKLTMINEFYKYFFIVLGLTITANALSNTNQIYAESECTKKQWTDKYFCQDSFNGSKYNGTGVVKNGWFIPSTQEQKTESNNNIVDSVFGIFSNSNNSDNTQDLIKKTISVKFKNKQSEVQQLKAKLESYETNYSNLKKSYSNTKYKIKALQRQLTTLQTSIKNKNSDIVKKNIAIKNKDTEFNSLKEQKYQGTELYLFFAVLLSIVSIVLITKNHRINIENAKDRQKLINNLASEDAKKEVEATKDKIVKEAKDKVYKKTIELAELPQSKTRLAAIKEVKDKIKGEYEKSADREKLKQDIFTKIKKEILDNISKAEQQEIKLHAMNDLKQKMTEELIANHSKEVSANLDIVEIKKEAEKTVKDKHFIEVMDEVRNEYKKTIFDGLSDKELEDLKKEVYLEIKQGFTNKSSAKSSKKNTSSTLDDFIDSL